MRTTGTLSGNLPKSTRPGCGISDFKRLVCILLLAVCWGPVTGRASERSYQVQFFATKLHGKIPYRQLSAAGVNKLLYRVFLDDETKGGLYFINTQFRTLEPALEQLIEQFDYKNMRLCAWMISRKYSWIHNERLFDYQYQDNERKIVRKLDIFNPDAVKKMIAAYKELASHRIDSILIQDDLTLRFNEGFSNWGKARFTAITDVPAIEKLMMKKSTPYHSSWKRVKVDKINEIVNLIVRSCKSVNTRVKVGMNVYYETPIYVHRAEEWYGHDLRALAATDLDYIYLMSYHRQIKDEMKWSETRNRQFFKQAVEQAYTVCKEKLVVKIQLRDWNTSERIPIEEARAYLAMIPPEVKYVCFTPVGLNDFDYLETLLTD